ncbi:MAG: oxidoreductase, partial [Bacteroidetes bacterium]|nr:oxidoreductase [Bacteroidota bacterium]
TLKTIPQGAATTIWAATTPMLNDVGGVYCEDVNVASLSLSQDFSTGVKPYSLNEVDAKRLWNLSEEMIGISFDVN